MTSSAKGVAAIAATKTNVLLLIEVETVAKVWSATGTTTEDEERKEINKEGVEE